MSVDNVNSHLVRKHLINLDLKEENKDSKDARSDVNSENDTSTVAVLQKTIDASDEMSAALSLYFSRKLFDNKVKGENNLSEWVLEQDCNSKSEDLLLIINEKNLSTYRLHQYAIKIFPDESDLAFVLREFLRRSGLDELTRNKIKSLLTLIEDNTDPKILKGGINTAGKARFFGKLFHLKPAVLRASYRQFLQNDGNLSEIYTEWLKIYGFKKREAVIDFIEAALISDINSSDPSCSKIEFGNLLAKCFDLKIIRSTESVFVNEVVTADLIVDKATAEEKCLQMLTAILQSHDDLYARIVDFVSNVYKITQVKDISYYMVKIYRASSFLPEYLFIDSHWRNEVLEKLKHLSMYNACREMMDEITFESVHKNKRDI
ncbi:TPA: type III secretion system gatekeeper subunit SctW [Salmonella enterica]|nr:hypothetical protein [Salmonella enterica subsp. diarizonae]HEA0263532.1 type III secretion system gatekeeper subunit SctW [Salmonella enterica]HEA0268726.1 type III secretion system gatekeeper subunit SctW [Salmonella enterica]HEA0295564.1 type III secretion system gatekeeper subunit SctW [Salmonella enterica]HEA0305130.1 type III secretion system gatekeeper subunit SctW [Salmonella enterica]